MVVVVVVIRERAVSSECPCAEARPFLWSLGVVSCLVAEFWTEAEPGEEHALDVYGADLGSGDEEGGEEDSDQRALYAAADVELGEGEGVAEVNGGEGEHHCVSQVMRW